MDIKYISFYTDEYYEDSCELIKTLTEFNLTYSIEHLEKISGWAATTQLKAPFILRKLKNYDSVVWTDADSRIKQQPSFFDTIDTDIGVYYLALSKAGSVPITANNPLQSTQIVNDGGYLQTGTMFFRNTPRTVALLEKWVELNEEYPGLWDQWTLQAAVPMIEGLTVTKLPPEYVWINHLAHTYTKNEPVIQHLQASRRLRNK